MSRLGLDLSEEKRALLERLLAEEGLDEAPAERIPRRAGGAPAPLSFAQERLWFLDSLEPGSTAYNMPFALALDGALDVGALRRALAGIVRRHEVLRTTFAERERRPVQVVSAAAETPLPRVDLAGVAAGERVCRALLKAAAARPFDLARGPLVRALLVRLGARRHVLLLDLHHIVADGASVGILVAETSALYAAGSAGRRSPLQAPPVQYADYAVWQRGALEGEPAERLIEWWRELLADVPPVLELPFDRPRPRERSGRGGRCRIAFGPDVTEALRSLGRAHRSSLFMTLLAGFGALLGRLSLQRRVVVGAPVENRDRAELRDLIGFFTNTLPLPVDLGASPSFERLLARVRETALGGFAHQELPFARMVEALRPERSLGHSPLFQVIFALQPAAEALRHALPGLVLEPLETDLGSAKFDLSLLLVESAGGLAGSFEYDRDLFDATTVERWASHLRALLAAAVARPGAPLEALPLLGAAESHQLALEWNDAPRPGPSALVHRRIAAVAAGRPDAVAVRRGREHLSYGALAEGARRWATRLRRSGVGPGVPVGVLMERRPALVSALLGVLEAGGSYLPLDPAYPVESLRFRLEDSGTRVVIADRASRPVVPGVDGLELLLSDPAAGAAAHTADEGADDEASEAREAREARTAGPPAAVFPEEVAYTIYTSGSTGRPKGVQITHGGFAERVRWGCGAFSGSELAGVLAATSITFDLSVFELFVPLAAGGGVVLAADALDLVDGGVADLDRGMRVTLVNTVPSVLAEVLRAGPLPGSVRTVNLAGETWPAQLAGALRPTVERLLNLYGPSEDTTYSTLHAVPAGADGAPPIGRPLPGTRAWVVDPDLRDVPIGVAGELCLGGGGLARSYARRPAWTAERFVPDPFGADPGARLYRTGDRARRDASGELDFLGRLDHQVKVRGYRIEPGEIEAALGHHPGIDRVVVAAHDQGGQGGQGTGDARLVAYVVAGEAAEPPGLGEMRRFLADTLPAHMLPSAVVVLSELPLTATGKVDRRRLPAPGSAASSPARRIAPRGPVEEAVAEVWREVLGVADAGAGDDFFDVGGHSLAAASVVSRLCGLFGVELPVRALFESPVLSDLAVRIASLRAGGTAAAGPPLERRTSLGEPAPLSFAQERLWFLHRLDPASPAYNLAAAVRLSGALDPARLERALATVEGRHAVLRSVLVEGPDGPVQVVRERPPLPLARVDLFRLGAPREVARRLVRRLARRPFDLASGPPWRATLIRLDAAEHLLLVEMHHAVSDGWSLGVLVRELAAFYQGVELEPPPVTYADFATWQRERLDGGRRERLLDAWRRRLADDPAALDLGADRPRPGFEGHRAGRVGLRVDAATTSALRALARDGGATLFIALLGAFQTLLGRRAGAWSGGPRRIPVGTPVAGRDRTEVEGLIGLFVNTLVLSTDVGGDPSFREVLARARETALDAYEHQDLPFAALVEALRPERSLGRTPLFQALLVLQNAPIPTPTLRLPGLELATEEVEPAAAKVDLALALREEGEGLAGTLEFSRELFDFTTVLRLRGHFLRLLAAITAAPDAPVAELPLLAAAERHQLVREWQGAPLAHGPELLHELVAAQARRTPDAIALEAGGERLSYRHLHRRAKALARRLRAAGVAPESVVGVCLGRGAGLVTALLGVLEAGGAYLPVDPAYPRERIAFLLGDAQRGGAGVVVTEEALRPLLAGYPGEVLTVGRDSPGAPTEAPPDRAAARPSAPASLAYVIYTSGSTGTPKGVALGHGGAVALVRWAAGVFPPEDLRAVLATTSVSFDLSVFEIFVPLALGGRVVLLDDALALVASPERAAAGTLLDTVPSALAEVLRAGALPPGLRTVDLAGEALGRGLVRALAEAAPDLRVLNLYGPSEDTTYSTWAELAPPEPGRPADPEIGRPVAGTRAHPLDGRLRPVPGGVTGDLYVAGAGLARGYLGRPATTAAAFLPDPFAEAPGGRLYRTGDRVRQRSDGTLDFLGRADHQVKLHGFRIELGEIEAALLGDPRVTGAAVLVRGDSLAAWVEPADLDAAALVEELRAVLPAYMVPATLEALVALPRTPNGKVDRAALARRAPARAPSPGGTPPGSSEERLLAAVWREVLGGGTPAVEDDFFAAGGHSLLAVRLVARLRARGVELPLRAVFEAPTLGELARRLVAGAGPSAVLAPAAGPDGTPDPRLSANQERLWFLDRLEPGAAAFNLPLALELDGGLDAGALGRAVAGIVRRHATLRSTFPEADGVPVRRVHPLGARVPMPVVDLSGLPAAAREAEALRRVRAASLHGFDLAVEPGFRSLLVRLADRRHAFVATLHHLVADGWSLGVFRAELAVLYARRSGSREAPAPPPLPRLPIAFSDYAAWERTGLESPEAEADLDARVERLHGAPGRLALPTDRPRPAAQGFARERLARSLPPGRVAELEALGRERGATLFMVLLSAFELVLARWAGERDFLIGTPVAHRDRVELEPLIGLLVNTLVLRATVPEGTFADHLARQRGEVLDAFARPELPFARLVERLRPERGLDRAPLVQVMFNLLRFPDDAFEARPAGLVMRALPLGTPRTDLDLLLTAVPTGDGGIALDLIYDPALFDRATVEELLAQLAEVLTQVAPDAGLPLDRISLVTPAARRWLPDTGRPLAPAGPAPPTITARLAEHARAAPERTAVLSPAGALSYGALAAEAAALAHRLRSAGVARGDRVAVRAARSPELVCALAGVLHAGAAFVVIDPAHPPARQLEVVRASRPRAWIDLAPEPPAGELAELLETASLADLACRLSGPRSWGVGGGSALEPVDPIDPMGPAEVGPEDLAYVAFTSGSTGRPKGIAGAHGPLSRFFDGYARAFAIGPGDRVSLLSGLAHDPLLRDLFAPLWAGAAVVVPAPADLGVEATPGALDRFLRRRNVTVTHLTPATARLLDPAGGPLPALRLVVFGGDRLLGADVERVRALAPGVTVVNGYGTTETPQLAAWEVLAPGAPARAGAGATVPVGGGVDGAQLWVVPLLASARGLAGARSLAGARGLAGVGELGEIRVRSRSLARGYLEAAATAERFLPAPAAGPGGAGDGDRVYRTGDLGRYLPGGRVRYHGRGDRQLSVRGFRVEPAEVELHLEAHPDVSAAAVTARPGPDGEPVLAAFVVPRPERAPSLGGRPRRRLDNGLAVVELHRGETDYLYREIFELQAYLRHGLEIRDGDVVLDVGANIGLFLLFAHRVAAAPRVYCFEPNPEVREVLEHNARLYGGDARIFGHGLAEAERGAEFTFFEGMSLLSGLYADEGTERELVRSFLAERAARGEGDYGDVLRHADDLLAERLRTRRFEVRLRPLSAVIAELGLERIDYLKINVEKSELDVVSGMRSEDWRRVRQVAIEIDVRDHLDPIRELLEAEGFETAVVQDELLAGSELYYLYAARPGSCPGWRRAETPGSHLRALPDLAEPPPLDGAELLRHLAARLPAYLVPSTVTLVERLPLTPSGKLDVLALKAMAAMEALAQRSGPGAAAAAGRPPSSATERSLAAAWGELLGVEAVGAGTDYFAAGGHSLLATRLLARVRDSFGVELALRQLFETPTREGFAAANAERPGARPVGPPRPRCRPSCRRRTSATSRSR